MILRLHQFWLKWFIPHLSRAAPGAPPRSAMVLSGDFDCLCIHGCCIVLEVSSPKVSLGGAKAMGSSCGKVHQHSRPPACSPAPPLPMEMIVAGIQSVR